MFVLATQPAAATSLSLSARQLELFQSQLDLVGSECGMSAHAGAVSHSGRYLRGLQGRFGGGPKRKFRSGIADIVFGLNQQSLGFRGDACGGRLVGGLCRFGRGAAGQAVCAQTGDQACDNCENELGADACHLMLMI